jgi:hypothetical protein
MLFYAALLAVSQLETTDGSRPEPGRVLKESAQVAEEPARDVGAIRTVIPDILQQALDDPYNMPRKTSCTELAASIGQLTAALGPDLATPSTDHRRNVSHLAEAGEQSVVNSFIPFRGLVREASGAAAAQRRLSQAHDAGFARRGFLRGIAAARRCTPVS